MLTPIPSWDNQGVIPPCPADALLATSHPRSPYTVSLVEVVRRFSISPKRIEILCGFLEYRQRLHAAGLTEGFQWLDGSFLENKEKMRGEDPDDIDVATFYHQPPGTTQATIAASDPLVFGSDGEARKRHFHTHAFLYSLEISPMRSIERLLNLSHYWYGVFSHSRRNFIWKGFLQVDLSSVDDAAATTLLTALSGGATP